MLEPYQPELGQTLFGNKYEKYELPEYACACFNYIWAEISRVYWNRYYWENNEEQAKLPNFEFQDVRIYWYKYPGRGMSTNKNWTPNRWAKWMIECLDVIRKCDPSNSQS